MSLPFALDHLRDRRIRDLAAYWLEKRDVGPVPQRRNIDPVDIPWALPFIWLCDYLPEERDFAYRLAGEAISEVPFLGQVVAQPDEGQGPGDVDRIYVPPLRHRADIPLFQPVRGQVPDAAVTEMIEGERKGHRPHSII